VFVIFNLVAEGLLKQGRLKFKDTLDLQVVQPQMAKQVQQVRDSDDASARNITVLEPKTIEVRGLNKEISKEQLELYFENRKSGGGPVNDITMRGQTAFVTFTYPDGTLLNYFFGLLGVPYAIYIYFAMVSF